LATELGGPCLDTSVLHWCFTWKRTWRSTYLVSGLCPLLLPLFIVSNLSFSPLSSLHQALTPVLVVYLSSPDLLCPQAKGTHTFAALSCTVTPSFSWSSGSQPQARLESLLSDPFRQGSGWWTWSGVWGVGTISVEPEVGVPHI
jgi:hypothetical protein